HERGAGKQSTGCGSGAVALLLIATTADFRGGTVTAALCDVDPGGGGGGGGAGKRRGPRPRPWGGPRGCPIIPPPPPPPPPPGRRRTTRR
ncbi:hypothetical protein DBA20_00065, partial [Pandoraea capi]|nr:hypothetical protein [Pandoraea sp. LA3]MDN4581387.1 hypothetical protein [Pandoraea capi]